MVKKKLNLISLISIIIVSLLVISFASFAYTDLSEADREKVTETLRTNYQNLPQMEFNFDDPAATSDSIEIMPYMQLAISEPNLIDGLVVASVTYEDKPYLMMAAELSDDTEFSYGAGLIDLYSEEVAYVAGAELESHEDVVDDHVFKLEDTGSDSDYLELEIKDERFIFKTSISKVL